MVRCTAIQIQGTTVTELPKPLPYCKILNVNGYGTAVLMVPAVFTVLQWNDFHKTIGSINLISTEMLVVSSTKW